MKNLLFGILAIVILFNIQGCQRPAYGLRSVNYKRTQQYIKRVHGYKPYEKKEGFFKRLGQWPKKSECN